MNVNYVKGVRLERKAKQILEAQGYHVIRAAGSHGFADLVAADDQGVVPVRFIQVKSAKGKGRPSTPPQCSFPLMPNAYAYTQEIWLWRGRQWYQWILTTLGEWRCVDEVPSKPLG